MKSHAYIIRIWIPIMPDTEVCRLLVSAALTLFYTHINDVEIFRIYHFPVVCKTETTTSITRNMSR